MDIDQLWNNYSPYLFRFGQAILIFVIGWLVSKWGKRLAIRSFRKSNIDEAVSRFLGNILQYAILAAALIASLAFVGIQTTSLVAIFASAGLAIGLALQGSLSNFASGVMILFFRPFNLGERVTAAGHTGKVLDIGLFATTLLTPNNERIILPNSSVIGNSITNHVVEGTLRGAVEVGVAYGADVAKVIPVLQKAAETTELVLAEPAPSVAFVGLGASSLDFKVLGWSNAADYVAMQHNLRTSVYDALNEAGIEIPFAQLVVHKAD